MKLRTGLFILLVGFILVIIKPNVAFPVLLIFGLIQLGKLVYDQYVFRRSLANLPTARLQVEGNTITFPYTTEYRGRMTLYIGIDTLTDGVLNFIAETVPDTLPSIDVSPDQMQVPATLTFQNMTIAFSMSKDSVPTSLPHLIGTRYIGSFKQDDAEDVLCGIIDVTIINRRPKRLRREPVKKTGFKIPIFSPSPSPI